ncbi:MAG: thioredoxin family protein [Pseudomonadota bacterium]|nr:thioredoxin family protein [Pseudomonadota bacterium]
MTHPYQTTQPERGDIDAMAGIVALDFGTDWCGYCKAAAPLIDAALASQPTVRHMKVEDGSGRALGRSFRVKLWPTVIVLKDGKELARVVRPADAGALGEALARAVAD